MATKQTETQNFFDMYNNLGDQRELIDREIKMLNSVQEGFDHCWTNQHTKVIKNLIFSLYFLSPGSIRHPSGESS